MNRKKNVVIDNVTLKLDCKPPREICNADGRPVEWNGLIYSPRFFQGSVQRFEAQLKNLRIFVYPDSIIISNSLHKYFHGNNFSDFHTSEIREAIEKLNYDTGIIWNQAVVKKLEYGSNIFANAGKIVSSLISYKGKDYLPMQWKGKIYGKVAEFQNYKIKAYDKSFESDLKFPLFRWEICLTRIRNKILLADLLIRETLQAIAKDSISKFQNTIKMESLNLSKLSASEKKSLAAMLNPLIREDLKIHNRETFKRDRRIFNRIMKDKSLCINDDTGELMEQKFEQLIEGKKTDENHITKKHGFQTCNIPGNRGHIRPTAFIQ